MASDVQLPWGSCTDDKGSDKGKCPGEVMVMGEGGCLGKAKNLCTCSMEQSFNFNDRSSDLMALRALWIVSGAMMRYDMTDVFDTAMQNDVIFLGPLVRKCAKEDRD